MGIGALMRRAVFLDRDGVLNQSFVRAGVSYPPATLEELVILPGVAEGVTLLAAQGLMLVVVTNQPDVARGTQTREVVEQINARLCAELPIDAVYVCYHDTADHCSCRKPQPGMVRQAARDHDLDLQHSFMVGDRWSDIAAGQAAGCTTFLIDVPYNQPERCQPNYLVADLYEAAQLIITLL
jgi:D-glycero-D-manno-heptose 1,7-bisphosphate phosphatase